MVKAATSTWLRADLLSALERAGVPAGPINDVAQAFADTQVVHRGMRIEMEDEQGENIPGVRLPIRFSRSPLAQSTPSPRLPNG